MSFILLALPKIENKRKKKKQNDITSMGGLRGGGYSANFGWGCATGTLRFLPYTRLGKNLFTTPIGFIQMRQKHTLGTF